MYVVVYIPMFYVCVFLCVIFVCMAVASYSSYHFYSRLNTDNTRQDDDAKDDESYGLYAGILSYLFYAPHIAPIT